MALQRTLSIVKPDGVARHAVGEVLRRFEKEGFRILGLRMIRLGREAAEGFYAVHRGKPFFDSLVTFITSAPLVAAVIEGPDAIEA